MGALVAVIAWTRRGKVHTPGIWSALVYRARVLVVAGSDQTSNAESSVTVVAYGAVIGVFT